MEIGQMTINQVHPYLNAIANEYGLQLNRYSEFRLARLILTARWA
jgi:uncharacterized membrane protein YcjF (UPF0283 family)